MASYFDEMGWTPLDEGQTPDQFLHMARLLRDYNMFEEMGMTQRLPPPASKTVVKELPTEVVTEKGVQCPICLKEFDVNAEIKKLPCKHGFHAECILPWLKKTNSCPLCRFELATDDEDYELYKKEKKRAKERQADIETLHDSMFS